MKKYKFPVLALIAGAIYANPLLAQTEGCDRTCLTGFADTVLSALAANNPAPVPLADGVKITNNGKLASLEETFWESANNIVYRWDIVNQRLGDTATVAVVHNADNSKTMLMVRLKVSNKQITEVE